MTPIQINSSRQHAHPTHHTTPHTSTSPHHTTHIYNTHNTLIKQQTTLNKTNTNKKKPTHAQKKSKRTNPPPRTSPLQDIALGVATPDLSTHTPLSLPQSLLRLTFLLLPPPFLLLHGLWQRECCPREKHAQEK